MKLYFSKIVVLIILIFGLFVFFYHTHQAAKVQNTLEEYAKIIAGSVWDLNAERVKEYLVGKGISTDRLDSKGYGSSRPVATNDNSAGRQLNRRTEYEITAN